MIRQSSLLILECMGALVGLSGVLVMALHRVQPQPYMDEIFHVRQTQDYCAHQWLKWDPKITTPPGLYLISYLLSGVTALLITSTTNSSNELCSTFKLRLVNVLISGLNFLLICFLRRRLLSSKHYQLDLYPRRFIFSALTISLTPVLFFFSILYYTDQLSLFCVLGALLAHLTGRKFLLVTLAAYSLLVRQTNVIWVLFFIGLTLEAGLLRRFTKKEKVEDATGDAPSPDLLRSILVNPFITLRITLQTLWEAIGLILVVALFILFVLYNGGITLGDKAAHYSVPHVVQLFYFAAFSAALTAPRCFVTLKRFIRTLCISNRFAIYFICATLLTMVCVYAFTYEHPYLLADNRHYTFYIWSRFFRRFPVLRYLISPLYVFFIYHVWSSLDDCVSILWKLGFFFCTALCLIPSPLLEFRYFIIPFVLWRLHLPLISWRLLVVECGLYIGINAITLFVFFKRPFQWSHEPGISQRFMW